MAKKIKGKQNVLLVAQTFFIKLISFLLLSLAHYFRSHAFVPLQAPYVLRPYTGVCDRFSILDVELCWQNEVKAYTNCTSSRFHCFVCFVWSGISLQGMLDGAEVKCMSDELKHTEPLSESYRKFCKFFIIFSLSYSVPNNFYFV